MRIIIAVTGASGSIYARQLIQLAEGIDTITEIALMFSKNGRDVMKYEESDSFLTDCKKLKIYDNNDFYSPPASGSSFYDAMVVVPASVGILARVASGVSDTLITRAADVMLKERRKLIFVLRETPLSLIHIENMQRVTVAGAIILPASPSFYTKPTTIEELSLTVTHRILSLLNIKLTSGWCEN